MTPLPQRPAPRTTGGRRRLLAAGALAAALVGAGAVTVPASGQPAAAPSGARTTPSTPSAATAADGSYVPVAPARITDTRTGLGLGGRGRIGAGGTVVTPVAGRGGLPAASAISAVVVNLTVVNATPPTYVTVYPADVARPTTSSTNISRTGPVATLVTVPLHADGRLAVYNAFGSADVVLDVVGYYALTTPTGSYGGLTTLTPYRKLDSRTAAKGKCDGPFEDGDGCWLSFDYKDDQGNPDPINDKVTGYVVNLTAVNATGPGYLTAWDGNDVTQVPSVSSLNFLPGPPVANLAIVKRGTNNDRTSAFFGKPWIYIRAYVPGHTVQVVVDVVGVMTTAGAPDADDARFQPLAAPKRIIDTRVQGLGGPKAMGAGEARGYTGTPVVSATTTAIAGSLTLVSPTEPDYLTAYPGDSVRPVASAVNAPARGIVTNGAMIALGYPPRMTPTAFSVYNYLGTANFLIDAAGTFELPAVPAAARATATRPGAVVRSDVATQGTSTRR